jgi:hypothetical protein
MRDGYPLPDGAGTLDEALKNLAWAVGALELLDFGPLRASHPDADWDTMERMQAEAYRHARDQMRGVGDLVGVRLREPVSAKWTPGPWEASSPSQPWERLATAKFSLTDARLLLRQAGEHDDTLLLKALDLVQQLEELDFEIRHAGDDDESDFAPAPG